MDISWPLPDKPNAAAMINALSDNATKERLAAAQTPAVHHSGQADVLVTQDLTLKIARNEQQTVSLAQETAIIELLSESGAAQNAGIALPTVRKQLHNAAGVHVATLRETVAGDNPMKLANEGRLGDDRKKALGQAIARMQAAMGEIGRSATRAHPTLCRLPNMQPRTDLDKLNACGDLLITKRADIAQQVAWARDVLASRREKITGNTVHLVEADTHINNIVFDEATGQIGFFDFGACGWTSTPEIIFKRFAEHPEVCLAAVNAYEEATGYNVDRELIIALAIGDQLGYNVPRAGDKPNPLQASLVDEKTITRVTSFLSCYERTRRLLLGEESNPAPVPVSPAPPPPPVAKRGPHSP